MKKNTFLLAIFFFGLISSNNFAQSAFPLEEGNTWYYEVTYPPQPPLSYMFQVVYDTLMPNGKSYWILEPTDMFGGRYIRSDSVYVYYWDPDCDGGIGCEKSVFNISSSLGNEDTINWAGYWSATLQGFIQTTLFNQSTNIYSYSLGGLIFADIELSNRFGYSWFEYHGDYQFQPDVWELKGCIISDTFYGEMTNVQRGKEIPDRMELYQNYPNPFNPSTKIRFTISDFGFTTLKVYDVLGNEVATLVNEEKPAGEYEIEFSISSIQNPGSGIGYLASGIYFYKLKVGEFIQTKKMTLLR